MNDRLRREYAEQLKQGYLQSGFKQGFEAGYAKAKEDFERPHEDCRDRLKEVFREYSSISGDMFHLSQIENIIDGEVWL